MSSPENSPLPPLGLAVQDTFKSLEDLIKTEPQSETPCSETNGSCAATSSSSTSTMTSTTSLPENNSKTGLPLTNGNGAKITDSKESTASAGTGNPAGKEDDPNEDWCAVCINGGDLLCCDHCPKVFHMKCHVPTIKIFPKGDFLCTFCRSLSSPEIDYCDDSKKIQGEQNLNPQDQRRCERLLLYIFCHELSVGFREPVPSSVPNYYKIIKHPMDLKKAKKKLQLRSSEYYNSVLEFVSDMRLIFNNCANYNEMSRIIQVYDEEKQINNQVGSEMAISGKAVALYFEEKLQEMFPGENFPEVPKPDPQDEKEKEAEKEKEMEVEKEKEKENVKEKDGKDTDDDDEDFIQPRRKRLKTDEKVLHIK